MNESLRNGREGRPFSHENDPYFHRRERATRAQALFAGPNANSHHLKQTAAAQQAAQNAANAAKAKRAAELAKVEAQKAEEARKAAALRERARLLKKAPPAESE